MKTINIVKFTALTLSALTLVNCAPAQNGASVPVPVSAQLTDSQVKAAQMMLDSADRSCADVMPSIGSAPVLSDRQTISGYVNATYRGKNVAAIQNGSGNLILVATSSPAIVEEIRNFNGNIVLCNVSVGLVHSSFKGNLLLSGGSIGKVDNFEGQIVVSKGKVNGSVGTFKGFLIWKEIGGTIQVQAQ